MEMVSSNANFQKMRKQGLDTHNWRIAMATNFGDEHTIKR